MGNRDRSKTTFAALRKILTRSEMKMIHEGVTTLYSVNPRIWTKDRQEITGTKPKGKIKRVEKPITPLSLDTISFCKVRY